MRVNEELIQIRKHDSIEYVEFEGVNPVIARNFRTQGVSVRVRALEPLHSFDIIWPIEHTTMTSLTVYLEPSRPILIERTAK